MQQRHDLHDEHHARVGGNLRMLGRRLKVMSVPSPTLTEPVADNRVKFENIHQRVQRDTHSSYESRRTADATDAAAAAEQTSATADVGVADSDETAEEKRPAGWLPRLSSRRGLR